MILRAKDKQRLIAIFNSVETPIEVWAYGSRVSGKAHEGSDLDLVMRTPSLQKMPIEVFVNVKEKIKESNIPIVVELFDWARLPESFHKNIEAQHEVLYSNLSMVLLEASIKYKNQAPNDGLENI
ncbi:nucleotidyltransferase domain-containing protein [Parasediminibacterium sp. JCM 36343]|uniref:nucleotidyltransferase domain-containing protein n=1 Tax=Parasediminibacterium sp. JCM 36343 TaxID=3374279 RepID=UPI00397C2006